MKQEPADLKSVQLKKDNNAIKHKKDMESSRPENTDKKATKSGKTSKSKKREEQPESISDELSALLQPGTIESEIPAEPDLKTGHPEDILKNFDFDKPFSGKERKGGKLKSGSKQGKEKASEESREISDESTIKKESGKPGGSMMSNSARYGRKPGGDRKFGRNAGTSDKKFGKKNFRKPGDKKWGTDKPFGDRSRDDNRKPGGKQWSNDKQFNDRTGGDKEKTGEKKWSDKPWRNDKPFGDRSRSGRPGFSKNKFGGKKKFGPQDTSAKKKFGPQDMSAKKKVFDVYKAADDGKSFNKEIYNREEDLYTYARSQERGKKGFDKSQLYKHIEPGAFSGIKKSHAPNKNFKKKFNPANKNKRKFF